MSYDVFISGAHGDDDADCVSVRQWNGDDEAHVRLSYAWSQVAASGQTLACLKLA
jgi:hypothetical protein